VGFGELVETNLPLLDPGLFLGVADPANLPALVLGQARAVVEAPLMPQHHRFTIAGPHGSVVTARRNLSHRRTLYNIHCDCSKTRPCFLFLWYNL